LPAPQIVSDLFGVDSYFDDTEAFWRLQNEPIFAQCSTYLEAEWQDFDQSTRLLLQGLTRGGWHIRRDDDELISLILLKSI
jgi:hypothetical protein